MSVAAKLFSAGYTDLVSVTPPDAVLAPTSKIDPSQRGKCPGKLGNGGWYGYGFTNHNIAPETIDHWGANIGLRGSAFPGLDIDVEDDALSRVVRKHFEDTLGVAPVRLSREPRKLLVYKTAEPFARIALSIDYEGDTHLVEFLGAGRQYVVHGIHPSGQKYGWEGDNLWDTSPDAIPWVTKAQVLESMKYLKERLYTIGVHSALVGVNATVGAGTEQDQRGLRSPNMHTLAHVVDLIPNPASWGWNEMIEFGYAVRAAGAEDEGKAFDIFTSWSERWDGIGQNPETDSRNWDSFQPPYRVGWAWLQKLAEENSNYKAAADEFEAIPGTLPTPVTPPAAVSGSGKISYTDEWAVAELLPILRDKICYIPGDKSWYVWNGFKWERNTTLKHELLVRDLLAPLAAKIYARVAYCATKEEAAPFKAAAKKFQNASGIGSVLALLQARLARNSTEFDRDPNLLNTPSGVVDTRTGVVSPIRAADMMTRSTSVSAVGGETPLWDVFLSDLTGGSEGMVRYIQKLGGYALTGDVSEKTLWFLWGSDSDTGKSTFVNVLRLLFGDYADSVDVSVFINSNTNRIPAELARLPGCRLVTATEPSAGNTWDEHRIKSITGGDTIEARFLFGQPFTYNPQFKILIVGNHEPEIRQIDDAMIRRIHIVPFNIKVPREKQVANLAAQLVAREGPAILHWFLQGCLAWREEGLDPPAAVLGHTEAYGEDEDLMGEWLQETCELGADYEVTRHDLFTSWSQWCRSRGEPPGGLKALKRRIDARGLRLGNRQVGPALNRKRGYVGLRLRARNQMGTDA